MNRYIILLRGVNVGGKNILPMKELKSLLEHSGFKNVATYIQSINLILQADKRPARKIGTLIETTFGFNPDVLSFTEKEF